MMEFHSVANIFPLMNQDELEALSADIASNGQHEPIWTHEGKIIDGRNRYRACVAAGIEPRYRAWDGCGSLVAFVLSLNLHRRHLNSSQRAVVSLEVEKYLAAEAKERMTAGHNQYTSPSQRIEQGSSGRAAEQAAELVGTNRQYVSDAKRLAHEAPALLKDVYDGSLTIPEAKRRQQELARAQRRAELQASADLLDTTAIQVWHGDFRVRSSDIPTGSVDLVLTDPPYPQEFLPLWADLARVAARVLKPGGFLVTYTGQFYLPQVMHMLAEHLSFYWLAGLAHRGPQRQHFKYHVQNAMKPILIYAKPPIQVQPEWFVDLVESPHADKEFHAWGQSLAPVAYLLQRFSEPGALVLDPFAGGGTTPVACQKYRRRCIAIEQDEGQYQLIRGRLAQLEAGEVAA